MIIICIILYIIQISLSDTDICYIYDDIYIYLTDRWSYLVIDSIVCTI